MSIFFEINLVLKPFSENDFIRRTVQKMKRLKILRNIKESNQFML